jgi:hypothetical protein
MEQTTSPLALTLVILGAIMSFGREPLTRGYLKLFTWLWRREPAPNLPNVLRLYLVFTGMIFTLAGLLGLLGIWKI